MDDSLKTLTDEALTLIKAAQDGAAALDAEFVAKGQPPPADRQKAVDDAMAAGLAKKEEARKAHEAHEARKGQDDARAWLEGLQKSAGRPPVGGAGLPNGAAQNGAGRTVVYKGRDGARVEYTPVGRGEKWTAEQEADYTEAFRDYVAKGRFTAEGQALAEARKGLLAGLDTSGGLWAVPEIVETQLIQAIADATIMRMLADVRTYNQPVSIRVLTAGSLSAAEWTAELTLATADTAEPAGARRLTPHPLSKLVYISEDELSMSAIDSEGFVTSEMGRLMGEAEENAFLNGNGHNKPLGLYQSSLPTVRRAAGAVAPTTTLHPLDFVNAAYDLKAQYRPGASWIMHREVERRVALFQDGTGEFMWRPGLAAGQPNTLQGYPINTSEFSPSTFTTGLPVAALGQWRKAYRIADVTGAQMRRLDEIAALSNQIVFKGRRHTDGMLVDGNAAVLLKMSL